MAATVLKRPVALPTAGPPKPLTALDISTSSAKSTTSESSTSRPFQRLRSSLEQTLRSATRSRKPATSNDTPSSSTVSAKGKEIAKKASEDPSKEKGTKVLQRLPSKVVSFRRGAREVVTPSPVPDEDEQRAKGRVAGSTSYRAPSLRQGSISSPALHLSSQALPSPKSRPPMYIPSSASNLALVSPLREKGQRASGSSRRDISSPLKLGTRREKADGSDISNDNTPSRHKSTPPVILTSPSVPSLPSKTIGRLRDRVPANLLERDLPTPPDTPVPSDVSRRQGMRSPSRTVASSSNISLASSPSPEPSTPTRCLSPIRARSPTVRTHVVSPSRLSPANPSPTPRKPHLESRRTSLDTPRRTSYESARGLAESPTGSRGDSPSPAPRRTVSPTHQSYSKNRHFKIVGSLEHRELIRNAASMLCREMIRPPPHMSKSEAGMKEWSEVERRLGGLKRLERVWGKSGAIGLGNPSGSIINAAGEDRERKLFADALRDGYILCHLINKRRSSSVVRPDSREDGVFRSSNVTKFLAACASYGLSTEDLFQPDDLNGVTSEPLARVAKTVIALLNFVDSPPPSMMLHGKKQGSVPVPLPYHGSISRASASTPNLLHISSSPPSSPTRKRWSPPSALPPLRSQSSEEDSAENSPRIRPERDQEEFGYAELEYAKVNPSVPRLMPPPRSVLRPRPTRRAEFSGACTAAADHCHADETQNLRQSVVSTAMTETTVTTIVSSILDNGRSWSGQNKFGTIRTVTTDLTSEAPSLSRTEGSNIAEDMARRKSTEGGGKFRDRKLSETPTTDLTRVAEVDEMLTWKRDTNIIERYDVKELENPPKPEKPGKVVNLRKGRWPDDFLVASNQEITSSLTESLALELDEEDLYTSATAAQQDLPLTGVSRLHSIVKAPSDHPRLTHRSSQSVDNPINILTAREKAPAVLRRHSTKHGAGQRNALYGPRSNLNNSNVDDDAAVPFPKASGGATPLGESPSKYERLKFPRGRFQSDVEECLTARRRMRPDEAFGRSRIESMISLGVSSNASASDLRSVDGSGVRKTIVVKEDGKPPVQYQLGNCIGRGQFGSVYRALNLSTGTTVAVKQIQLEGLKETEVTELMREVNIYQRLSHPGIVRYEGMARDAETLSIVLEFAENGSLGQTLKAFGRLNECLVASYVAKILEGLHYLHGQDVVHCDLKAANILTTKTGNVKLTDFGVSLNLRAMACEFKNVAGTPNWMAPEIIELKGASAKSDIWSLACTVIELLTGRPPYSDISNSMTVMFRIVEDAMPPLPSDCSDLAREFLTQCFNKDPTKRPSAEILFEHPWLKRNWGIYKELRPQDSIPFLRRVSVDLQKSEAVRYLAQIEMPLSSSPDSPLAFKESPLPQSPLEQRRSAASVRPLGENDFSPREHSFVKTTFSKSMNCRVCSKDVKRSAVICSQCSLVSHTKCAPNAPPTCDLRAQLLQLAQYAEKGSPGSLYHNPAEDLGSSRPHGPMSDIPYVTHPPESSQPSQPLQQATGPPAAFKLLSAFKRSRSNLVDPNSSTVSASQRPATSGDDKVVRRKAPFRPRNHERPLSFTSNSTGMSSLRSAATAAESFSSGPDRGSYPSMDRSAARNSDSGRTLSRPGVSFTASTAEGAKIPGALPSDNHKKRDSKTNGNCVVQ